MLVGSNSYYIPENCAIEVTKHKIIIIHNGTIMEIDR